MLSSRQQHLRFVVDLHTIYSVLDNTSLYKYKLHRSEILSLWPHTVSKIPLRAFVY